MASHEPFGHLQPKLWAKERPGVKLAIWFPTTKSHESTSSRHPLIECDMELESSRGELQLWFRPRPDRRSGREIMFVQSLKTPTRGSFGTPPWESQEKKAIWMQPRWRGAEYIIWRKVVVSPKSRPWWVKCVNVPVACPNTQGCSRMWTNPFVVGFGCRFMWDHNCPSS